MIRFRKLRLKFLAAATAAWEDWEISGHPRLADRSFSHRLSQAAAAFLEMWHSERFKRQPFMLSGHGSLERRRIDIPREFGDPLNILGMSGFTLRRRFVSPDGQTVRFSDKPIDGFIELSNVAFIESPLSAEEWAKRAN